MTSRRLFAPLAMAAAVVGGGIAGAAIGVPAISGAQESPAPEAPESGAIRSGPLQAAATALGIEPRELMAGLRDGTTIAELAQERGVDVNTVIDAMVASAVDGQQSEAEIRERITSLVNEGPNRRGGQGRDAPGHFRGHRGGGEQLDAAAEALGPERDELVAELRDGATIAEIAEAQGVDVDTVVDAMVGEARERIESFVNESFQRPDSAPDGAPEPDAEGSSLS